MATNFLHSTSTASNGFLVSPFLVIGTTTTSTSGEFTAIANGSGVVSNTNGASGVFNFSNTAAAQYGYFYATTGNSSGWLPTAGGNLTGYFIHSPDGGTTFLTTAMLPPAIPDFIIPFGSTAGLPASSIVGWSPLVLLPYNSFKVYLVNNSGATSASVNNFIKCAPVADQY